MHRLQDQHLEHQHMIERRPPTPGSIRARNSLLEVGAKQLKINETFQPLQVVALRRELSKPLVHIKKARLPSHSNLRLQPDEVNQSVADSTRVSGGVQLPILKAALAAHHAKHTTKQKLEDKLKAA